MPYDKKNVLTSERPYQVFAEIVKAGEEGSYSTEISDNIGSNQQNVSEMIKVLKELGMIQKGKRTRAQYYKFDEDGVLDIFLARWESKITGDGLRYRAIEEIVGEIDIPEEKLKIFLSFYVQSYCKNQNSSTIQKMLMEDFFEDLDRVIALESDGELLDSVEAQVPGHQEVPVWLEKMHTILEFINQPEGLSHNISTALIAYYDALEEMEEK